MTVTGSNDVSTEVSIHLPYLRRYARALTGNQDSGDAYAISALEAVLADPTLVTKASDRKVALFRVLHAVWSSTGAPVAEPDSRLSAAAQLHLAQLTPNSREALLLHTLEGFSILEVAQIIGGDADEVNNLVNAALGEMADSVLGRIMIIEDEAIIAMDLTSIVEDMGHTVISTARTRTEAVEMAQNDPPDLVLADIQLADNSSGVDAVNDILRNLDGLPVIFITAFPERLLTGERPEPAFMITKPYTEEQVRSAVSQAMFFASTETLVAP